MGLSSSKAKEAAPPPLPSEGKFGVRISPALIESTHAASGGQVIGQAVDGAVTLSPEEHNEMLQRAFQEGADYAAAQLVQRQAPERENILAQLAEQNEGKMQALAARIEELKNREYRPPSAPMGCKEEREAVLQCYRANRASSSELVYACSRVVQDLDKCATAVRGATMAKIVPGSLQS